MRSIRPGSLPWLKMMTALAPAAVALAALSPKAQVPRWTRAMFPGVNPAKSDASHPEVLARSPARRRSTPCTVAVTSPEPE